MTPRRTFLSILPALAFLSAHPDRASAEMSDLVGLLTSQLGVSEPQAAGGAGALFNYVKQQLSPADFGTVSSALPGVDGLVAAAPAAGGASSTLGSAGSLLGGTSSGAGGLASLAGPFSELGMSPDMIGQFVPVVLDYAKGVGGEQVMGLLQSALLAG